MNKEFNTIQISKPKRNFFDLSHERKFSLDMGRLVPILCQEVLPGDTFNVTNQQLIRFAPMLAPIMHKVDVFTHYFFVPNRLTWDNWDEFISGNQGQAPEPAFPIIKIPPAPKITQPDSIPIGSIGDYLGLPVGRYHYGESINAQPIAAINLIWNEYYRDQNLQDELPYQLEDGDNSETFLAYLKQKPHHRAWEHDYFTSALPFTQKGEEVLLTFDTESVSDVEWRNMRKDTWRNSNGESNTGQINGLPAEDMIMGVFDEGGTVQFNSASEGQQFNLDNSKNLFVDLAGTYLMSVNQLRQAMALQRWLELNARAGSRYIETILAHFGVKSADARLQRPEYLGGGKSPVAISEVLQMSESIKTPQGTMAGHGINYGQSHEFKSYFTEHGLIIGFMSIRPKTAYQQGIPKLFLKNDKFDYFWNILAHLGEQPVLKKELYVNSEFGNDAFGYVPRYSEYKYINSTVHGDFTKSLDFWHMGRIFENEPELNSDFISCKPTTRIFAVTDDEVHHIWCHLYQQVKAVRPIPVFSTPLLNG